MDTHALPPFPMVHAWQGWDTLLQGLPCTSRLLIELTVSVLIVGWPTSELAIFAHKESFTHMYMNEIQLRIRNTWSCPIACLTATSTQSNAGEIVTSGGGGATRGQRLAVFVFLPRSVFLLTCIMGFMAACNNYY